MTNEEAIRCLQNIVEYWTLHPHEQECTETAISALRERIDRRHPQPLTLEQLQKGDTVWIKDLVIGEIKCLRFDRIEPATYHPGDDYRFEQFGTDVGIIRWACTYGINWLAYRRKPEGSTL